VQQKETFNQLEFTDFSCAPEQGRILALDLGKKRVGVAVSDELQIIARPLKTIERKGWKKFLSQIIELIADFDARALVLGLPLESDGTESEMSLEARRLARNFSLSLDIPVFLQDERLSSFEAKGRLWEMGFDNKKVYQQVDSEAAAIILSDFLEAKKSLRSKK
jgi:putative Holliday junction resolvase